MTDTVQGTAREDQLEVKLRLRMQGEAEPVEAYVHDVLNLCYKIDHNMLVCRGSFTARYMSTVLLCEWKTLLDQTVCSQLLNQSAALTCPLRFTLTVVLVDRCWLV